MKFEKMFKLITIFSICFLTYINGAPVANSNAAVEFLTQFKYLKRSESRGPAPLRSSDEYSSALRRYQRDNGLKVDGTLNRETAELMSLPRCGNTESEVGNFFTFSLNEGLIIFQKIKNSNIYKMSKIFVT